MNPNPNKNTATAVWTQIEALVKNIHGWTPIDELYTLYNLVWLSTELDVDVVEVGS